MYYFGISDQLRQHLGFMVLIDEQDSAASTCEQGYFAIKIANDVPYSDSQTYQTLLQLSIRPMLLWQKQGDYLQLSDEDGVMIGKLQQQFLQLHHQHYILEDLTGTI